MREILFKGLQKGNGSVVTGDFVYRKSGPCIRDRETGKYYKVELDSVQQYIGRVDKNGIKIFENDCVKPDKFGLFTIVWDSEDCRYLMEGFDGMKYAKYALGFESSQLEVIKD